MNFTTGSDQYDTTFVDTTEYLLMDVPTGFQIPLVVLVSLIGFLVVLKLSDFSVQSNTTTTTSSDGIVNFLTHSEASEINTSDNAEESRQAPSSPKKTPMRIPKDAEGTIFTPVGRRSVRIARRAKDE